MPFALIGIGVFILYDSGSLALMSLGTYKVAQFFRLWNTLPNSAEISAVLSTEGQFLVGAEGQFSMTRDTGS